MAIGSFKKANNLYEDRILEGRPSLEKSQIDFSEMEDCPVSSGNVLLGTKLLTFSLNSGEYGVCVLPFMYCMNEDGDGDENGIPTPDSTH
ncbi:Plant protein of unknown function D [Prunus dulcis]|uniref:Uncharacterized protein n=1 Tax=Prunus dulcis TaxID=3755 RepID=A0A5H2XVP1_PRUDU|nr:Plant protein of unknown function D [Prunus dulcis]